MNLSSISVSKQTKTTPQLSHEGAKRSEEDGVRFLLEMVQSKQEEEEGEKKEGEVQY